MRFRRGLDARSIPPIRIPGEQTRDRSAMLARLSSLTPQQVRVLMMLSEGLLNKQIAYELGVSEATVKAHVSAILITADRSARVREEARAAGVHVLNKPIKPASLRALMTQWRVQRVAAE